ncbi:MAG: substrate-binding domain-containing protein [Anaerolineae bacterium]|nr:substrate-binding domain-containing protein [Anaerolineae bacterium]
MKRTLALTIALAVALVAASCAPAIPTAAPAPAPAGPKQFKIGVATFTLAAPYFVAMSKAVVAEAAFFENIEVFETDAGGDAEKLTANIEDLIAKGVDGIIVNAGPIEALPAGLDAIKKAGIPVVMVDRKLKGGDYNSWIGPDNYQIGVDDGKDIVARLGGQGRLLVIRGGPADNTIGLDRTNGMLSEVKKTAIEVVMAPDFGGWSEDGGFKVMEDMLAKYDKIDAVFCENDSMCLGAQKAIADAGRSAEMFLCGVDGQKEALKAIIDGTNYVCTGKNDSDEIGRAGFHRLMAILAGAVPEHDTVLPSPHLTPENACQYYNPDSLF